MLILGTVLMAISVLIAVEEIERERKTGNPASLALARASLILMLAGVSAWLIGSL